MIIQPKYDRGNSLKGFEGGAGDWLRFLCHNTHDHLILSASLRGSLTEIKCISVSEPSSTESEQVLRPKTFQFVIQMEGQISQHLFSWTPEIVQILVQLSEVGGVWRKHRGQTTTADIWQNAVTQSKIENKQGREKVTWGVCLFVCESERLR